MCMHFVVAEIVKHETCRMICTETRQVVELKYSWYHLSDVFVPIFWFPYNKKKKNFKTQFMKLFIFN